MSETTFSNTIFDIIGSLHSSSHRLSNLHRSIVGLFGHDSPLAVELLDIALSINANAVNLSEITHDKLVADLNESKELSSALLGAVLKSGDGHLRSARQGGVVSEQPHPFNPNCLCKSCLSNRPQPRLIATFRPQVWVNDDAVDTGSPTQFDATEAFLTNDLLAIQRWVENTYYSDDLADDLPERVSYDGPFEVDADIDTFLKDNGIPDRKVMGLSELDMLRFKYLR